MAGRLAYTPDERAVSEAVLDALNHADTTAIANAILDDPQISPCIDREIIQTYDIVDVLVYAIPDNIGKDAIVDFIMTYLQDLKFTAEHPPPPPNQIMDATMLREQILANARVLHTLYQHVSPGKYAEAEVIVASHLGKRSFSAHVVRTRQSPAGKTDLAVTMEVKGYRTHVEALGALLHVSRNKLTSAFEASENKGGKLGNWELLELK